MQEKEADAARTLRQETEHAMALSMGAASLYECGSPEWAGLLHAAAQRSHFMILAGIADLNDEEADALEPFVTSLEEQLHWMSPYWIDPADRNATQFGDQQF